MLGFHAFTGSDYTASFNCKGKKAKFDFWNYLREVKTQKKAFSVLKGTLLSEREVQTTFKATKKFTCAMHGREKKIQLGKRGLTFS